MDRKPYPGDVSDAKRAPQPPAALLDRRIIQSTPESGSQAGYDGAKRRKLHATPSNARDRAQVERLAAAGQAATGATGEIADVDQG